MRDAARAFGVCAAGRTADGEGGRHPPGPWLVAIHRQQNQDAAYRAAVAPSDCDTHGAAAADRCLSMPPLDANAGEHLLACTAAFDC